MRFPRSTVKRALRWTFEMGQRAGVDILPRHFYSSIPDVRALRRERSWRTPYTMVGLHGSSIDDQVSFLRECCAADVVQRTGPGLALYEDACRENGAVGYGPIEALFLYCFVATQQPAKVVQVGAGVSSAIVLRAAREAGYRAHVVCIDPFPTPMLRARAAAGELELIERPAQELDTATLMNLGAGDLFFVDSTHTVKPGSEVSRMMLEVLPRLAPGVFAHFHDICLPYDYSPTLLEEDVFFWEETVLLHAFLCGNADWRLRAALSMIHHASPDEMARALPPYRPARFEDGLVQLPVDGRHFPSAAYLERVA